MTEGFLVSLDWVQDTTFEHVIFNNPWNGVSIQQAGNTQFVGCLMDIVRGQYGVYAFGSNTMRNGENDQIDIVTFDRTVLQSGYVAGGAAPTADLLMIDGRVHTVQIAGLRLLNAKRGLVTMNTPGLASNFVPRFITGFALEVENMYAECLDLQAVDDFWIDNIFAVGSQTADGIKLSSQCGNFRLSKGTINSNFLHGLNKNGAKTVSLTDVDIYNNSLVGNGLKSGIYADGIGVLEIKGGTCGKADWLPDYTENQKYGIDLDPIFNGTLTGHGTNMRGNVLGAIHTGSSPSYGSGVVNCPGFNPQGPLLVTPGPSPHVYMAGLAPEVVSLYDGSGVVAAIGDVVMTKITPATFLLAPLQSVSISYVTAPTVAINRL
ncbi:hypothetical protein BJL96_11650 [Burkholderia cenocepacia]|nr:hypothetical protein [Burkholderia cenocepacia]